jgi:predicted O-linked N-acetylglucosamine transferase (SPINDLY family)
VPRDRLDLVDRVPRLEYMGLYGRADVCLDTFPYNGHTTTCDSLFMGVPVVSMAGRTHVARMGLSINAALGLEHTLVARSLPDYVKLAVDITKDLSELQNLRSALRGRFLRCAWCDQVAVTRKLEAALRGMWRNYVANIQSDATR